MGSDLTRLQSMIDRREDIDERADLAVDQQSAPLYRLLRYRTLQRQANRELAALARAQDFQQQQIIDLLSQLTPLGEDEGPLIEVMRGMGLQAARRGDASTAMAMLEAASTRAATVGQQTDPRSRALMRYLLDPEIDAAYTSIATRWAPPRFAACGRKRLRITMVVSAIAPDNSGTTVALGILNGLRSHGHDVSIISTGHVRSADSAQALSQSFGVDIWLAPALSHEGRVRSIIDHASTLDIDVSLYLTFPMDAVAKVVSAVGVARKQIFLNTSYEQYCGRFDAIAETVSPAQISVSTRPDIARYVGTGLIKGGEIDAAQPAPRSSLGIPEKALVFGIVGRLQKCVEGDFLDTMAALLNGDANGYLALVGPSYGGEDQRLSAFFSSAGVLERVKLLGPRGADVPAILKSMDVYLDTFPFPGAQSILEAMWAGLPVVAMKTITDRNLDPSQCGPTTATAEAFIGEALPMADAHDTKRYIEIAREYARDDEVRQKAGISASRHVRNNFSFDAWIARINDLVVEVAAR